MDAGNHISGDTDIGFADLSCDHVDDLGVNQQAVKRIFPSAAFIALCRRGREAMLSVISVSGFKQDEVNVGSGRGFAQMNYFIRL